MKRQRTASTALLMMTLFLLFTPFPTAAQQPIVHYTLKVDTADLSHVNVTLELRNVPRIFHLAMATHFLNRRNYSRNIEDVQISGGALEHVDVPLWKATVAGTEATIRYKVRIEDQTSGVPDATQPFLTTTGGLLGDLHMFLYLVESPPAPAHVTLELPSEWKVATALAPTSDVHVFYAGNAEELLDAPILAGKLREWRFNVEGVPVRVAFWPLPKAAPFEEGAVVGGIEKIVRTGAALFGGAPWREYVFQLRDGSRRALEHRNCVTVGVQSGNLATNPHAAESMIAHEFFHTWNMMRIHPAEYHGPDYRPVPLSGLWLSEGGTMFYADLLLRRAGLPPQTPTRMAHLETVIADYLSGRGYPLFSAEQISLAAFDPKQPQGGPGDYALLPHVHGELLVAMLDLIIRDATEGRRSMDDVMRSMLAQYAGKQGFTTKDVERIAGEVCGCSVAGFFDSYVRGAAPIDFNRYLQLAGLRMDVEWRKYTPEGKMPDDRREVYAWMSLGETAPRIQLMNPENGWGRAGVHTGDQILKINGSQVKSVASFRKLLEPLHIGDTIRLEFMHEGDARETAVTIGTQEVPVVRIRELSGITTRQREMLIRWSKGEPF